MGGEEWASPQSVRATITILLSAGAPPQAARMPRPPWAGVRGGWLVWRLFQVPLLRSDLLPPSHPTCLWGPPHTVSRGTPGCPRAPERRHGGHCCHPVGPAGHPPHRPPHPAHLHLVSGQGRDCPGRAGVPVLGHLYPFPTPQPRPPAQLVLLEGFSLKAEQG